MDAEQEGNRKTAAAMESIRKRKLTYFGHMMRKKEESLEKEIIQAGASMHPP